MLENLIFTYSQSNDLAFINKISLISLNTNSDPSSFAYLQSLESPENVIQDNLLNIYHYSTPNVKLYYPEPFISSGTFLHYDLWFLHIAIYQYWLWFFFIFIIIFFIITFLVTLRWCNIRVRPQRETRGVSRSKCGDLITATVPVSWACSIIIHESTDSIEYYDGFGTTEMAVGIRAYQWGWEYYYPKDIDINYRIKSSNSTYMGNSLNYNTQNQEDFESLKYLNYYSTSSSFDSSIGSTSLLTLGVKDKEFSNIWDFKNFGLPKQAIKWAYKSINDSRIYEKVELDPSFYSYNGTGSLVLGSSNSLSSLDFINRDTSVQENYNSEWALLPNNSSFSNSKSFSNLKFLEIIKSSAFNDGYDNLELSLKGSSTLTKKSLQSPLFTKYSTLNKSVKDNSLNINNKLFIFDSRFVNSFANWFDVFSKHRITLEESNTSISNLISSSSGKLSYLLEKHSLNGSSKWPSFYSYAELDFKRDEDSELLEEMYWEYSIPDSYIENLESLLSKNKSNSSEFFLNKGNFGLVDKGDHYKFLFTSYPGSYLKFSSENFSTQLNFEAPLINYSDISKNSLSVIPSNDKVFEVSQDSFSSYKNGKIVRSFPGTNSLVISFPFSKPNESQSASNSFWVESESPLILTTTSLNLKSINFSKSLLIDTCLRLNLIKYNGYLLDNSNLLKLSDRNSLIESTKNISTFNNSLWKIYRPTFFEGRSSVDYKNFSNTSVSNPVINSSIPDFKTAVSKNQNYFLSSNLTKKVEFGSIFNSYMRSKNNFYFEFPFFLSLESDSIRYSWFDWYSKSSKRVTKAMDTASYNLFGNSLYTKDGNSFDFLSDNLSNYENYQIKMSNARKVHLPNWTYSLLHLERFKLGGLFYSNLPHIYDFSETPLLFYSLSKLHFLLNKEVSSSNNGSFFNSSSNNDLPSRNYWKTPSNSSSINYYYSKLGSAISKRDYLLSNLNCLSSSSLSSPLFNIISYDVDNYDDRSYVTEHLYKLKSSSRFLKNVNNMASYFKLKVLKDVDFSNKSQYKHMRKNISNMIRIHADKAVAMPTETRIQILTLSKDIIHSWSIPSAGIKIDCIPGYSSHKVTIFLLSGVYWGQCMEICGRFHHWMPIVVYFMKRDLFIMWCTHFISKNESGASQHNNTSSNLSNFFDWSES